MIARQIAVVFASVLAVSLVFRSGDVGAQTTASALDARSSDPVAMRWMVGSPPPPAKLIRYVDGSYYAFPQTRWSYSNIRQFLPTRAVARGNAVPGTLLKAERADLDAVTFQPIGGGKRMTWEESLLANYTDGILILHKGRIVYESYFGVLTPLGQHIAFSVTKSFVAIAAAALIAEGVLDEQAVVAKYVPELEDSGFGDATLRQLLDMTTGVKYSEHYDDPNSSIWDFRRATGVLPRPVGYKGSETAYEYVKSLGKEYAHGQRFDYKTVNTDVLGWVMSRVTGKSLSDLIRERYWNRLGMEQDAYFIVDSAGTENAGGGLNLTLRDMARFGEMIRLRGQYNGKSIVPASVIDDIRRGGNRELFARAGYKTLPGWSYRSMWWVSHNRHGAFTARGIHGQAIYIDPVAEMVVVRFASHPQSGNVNFDATSLPAYEAIADHLISASR
jgi:CubicO group peptidase (beta-lactamase class C family)